MNTTNNSDTQLKFNSKQEYRRCRYVPLNIWLCQTKNYTLLYIFFFYCRSFTSLCYSADGESLIAGGQSKNVCIYNVKEALILKKFEITQNRSLDAVDVSIIYFNNLQTIQAEARKNVKNA